MRFNNLKVLLLLAGISFWLPACEQSAPPPAPEKKSSARPSHLVETATVESRPLSYKSQRSGTVTARKIYRVYSQEDGEVVWFPFYEGDAVKQDQVLARLDDSLLQAQLDKARAVRKQAQLNLKRITNLAKQQLGSEEELAQAKTDLQVAQAEEAILETQLTHTVIRSPFAGVVSDRQVEPGDYVASHTHLLTIMDPTSLMIELTLSELLLPHLKTGDPVDMTIDALGPKQYHGVISRIHPVVDSDSRRGRIEVQFDPIPAGARVGQFARVTLRTRRQQRTIIPLHALRRDRQSEFIYVVRADTAQRVNVQSGLRFKNAVEVFGVEPQQRVVVRGFLGLRDGKKVTDVSQPTEDAAKVSATLGEPSKP